MGEAPELVDAVPEEEIVLPKLVVEGRGRVVTGPPVAIEVLRVLVAEDTEPVGEEEGFCPMLN